jgi:hypothetical protein
MDTPHKTGSETLLVYYSPSLLYLHGQFHPINPLYFKFYLNIYFSEELN